MRTKSGPNCLKSSSSTDEAWVFTVSAVRHQWVRCEVSPFDRDSSLGHGMQFADRCLHAACAVCFICVRFACGAIAGATTSGLIVHEVHNASRRIHHGCTPIFCSVRGVIQDRDGSFPSCSVIVTASQVHNVGCAVCSVHAPHDKCQQSAIGRRDKTRNTVEAARQTSIQLME